jgi:hypothetical protein
MRNEVKVEVDTPAPDILEEYAARLAKPAKDITIRTDRRALYAYPGTAVSLSVDRALAPGGVATSILCSVEGWRLPGPDVVELDLRYARDLAEDERP